MSYSRRTLSAVLFAGSVFAQSVLPTAPGAHIVNVAPSGGHYTEPGIAINPKNPQQAIVVFQGGKGVQGTATAAYSNDAGQTFTIAQGTAAPDWRVLGDVTTTFDDKGNAYLCYIAFDRLGTSNYWAHGVSRNGIFVRRSPDGGKTWDPAAVSVKSFVTNGEKDMQFEDEPRIFADNNAHSGYAGTLYVGWVEWQLTQSVMLFSRSIDQAKTWSAPIRISTLPGLPRDDNGGLGGYAQAIALDGEIFGVWADANSIVFTNSRDGGRTFHPSRSIIHTGPPYFGEVPGVSRVEGFPQIAIDSRSNLYVCWSDYTNGDVDVFLATSSNHGRTWSVPIRVNDDPVHNGIDQFYQWMTLDPITGDLYVVFYDRRADAPSAKTRITLARSTDAGRSFHNYDWTAEPFDPSGAFLGDYTWIAAYSNRVLAAWTEVTPQATTKYPETIVRVGTADFTQP